MSERVWLDAASNFHPYECDGPGKCVHCDRLYVTGEHDPATCALCDPAYDYGPALAGSGPEGAE